MIHLLKDKYLLLPFVEKTDFLYTIFGLTPNLITIFNGLVISSFLLYYWILDQFWISFFLLFIRNILDGVDGYIARKYKLVSKNGEIYDHICDSIFIGFSAMILLIKLEYSFAISSFLGQSIIIISMIINFSDNLFWIAENIVGAGGGYDSYCSLIYYGYHILLMLIYYCN
jgi:phosphatidylglycerophosphate synthase